MALSDGSGSRGLVPPNGLGLRAGSAVILAGGENRRFGGSSKARANIAGRAIVERQLATLSTQFSDIAIATRSHDLFAEYSCCKLIDASEMAHGPLAGVVSALSWNPGAWVFCVACDLPFFAVELVIALLSQLDEAKPMGAVVPVFEEYAQPTCAIYFPAVLPLAKEALTRGNTSLMELLKASEINGLHVKRIELSTLTADPKTLDLWAGCFAQVTTQKDANRFNQTF